MNKVNFSTENFDKIIKGFREGKIIQHKPQHTWLDVPSFDPRDWHLVKLIDSERFRVKPVVEYVPLEPKDIPFPCRIRYRVTDNTCYYNVKGVHIDSITVDGKFGDHTSLSYKELQLRDDMVYSGVDGVWKPFMKLKE